MPELVTIPTGYLAEKADLIARTVDRIRRQDGHATLSELDLIRFNAEAIAAEADRWLEAEAAQ